jgi:hypothetical protein
MKKERNRQPQRKMKPVFLVFCEGETEETYVNFLRQKYRLPIKVITHVTGLSISLSLVRRYMQAEKIGPGDVITYFLMYDLDVEAIAKKLRTFKQAINAASNPCVELWFLLHSKDQRASISTNDCVSALQKATIEWIHYEKGLLSDVQKMILWDNRENACKRAKQLQDGRNPSSSVYRLIEAMEEARPHQCP